MKRQQLILPFPSTLAIEHDDEGDVTIRIDGELIAWIRAVGDDGDMEIVRPGGAPAKDKP